MNSSGFARKSKQIDDGARVLLAAELLERGSGSLSRYFSTRVLRDLAAPSGGALFRKMAETDDLFSVLPLRITLEEFYDIALSALIRQDRSEYVFKNAIAQKLLLGRHSINTAALLFEFKAGRSKLDALLLNGSSHAYEIKTGKDELKRLSTQIPDYQERFEYVSVVCSERHTSRLRAILPREVGIIVLSDRFRLSTVRRASKRTKYLRSHAMIDSLRVEEYLTVLEELDMPIDRKSLPNTFLYQRAREVFGRLEPRLVHAAMVRRLKSRFRVTNVHAAVELPRSLTAAGIGLNISRTQLHRLRDRLRVPISQLEMS